MRTEKIPSWLDYIKAASESNTQVQASELEEMKNFLVMNESYNTFLHYSIPAIYLIDYTSGRYVAMSKSTSIIMGHQPEEFTGNGICFTLDNYHKEDLRLFDKEIFPDRIALLKNIPAEDHRNHIFSYSFRFKSSEGKYINLLQRNCFVKSDENGNPLLSLGMILNIAHFKNENPVIQTVEKVVSGELPATIYKKSFYLHEENRLFTAREKEVLLWSAEGMTSKEIAAKLNVSEHTVINHRRNMQDKSNTRNITQLISFAIRNGII